MLFLEQAHNPSHSSHVKLQQVHDNKQFRQILDLGGHGQGTVAMMHDHIQDFPTSLP